MIRFVDNKICDLQNYEVKESDNERQPNTHQTNTVKSRKES
jgi:hypothetical protein